MAKFIPLTCESCGGALQVKEGLKYVTCGHCQTKFQVIQENKTLFLETININVTSKIEQEYCEIVFDNKTSLKFWAKAIGKNGVFSAGETWGLSGDYPRSEEAKHVIAHDSLVFLLTKSGWQPIGRNDPWYSTKFSRTPLGNSKEARSYALWAQFGQVVTSVINNSECKSFFESYFVKAGGLKRGGLLGLGDISELALLQAICGLNSRQIQELVGAVYALPWQREQVNNWIAQMAEIKKKIKE